MKVQIINGPNLNLLGVREPSVYGDTTFGGYLSDLRANYPAMEIDYFQSNIEGEIINKIHEAGFESDGIILNAGGYTHTSVAIRDAIRVRPVHVPARVPATCSGRVRAPATSSCGGARPPRRRGGRRGAA